MPGFDETTLIAYVLVGLIILFAGAVHGTMGLGFPMVATPLLALLTDVRSAVLITLLPTIAVNILSILKGGRWRESVGRYWPMVVYVAVGAIAGAMLLVIADPEPFRLLLAGIILLYLNARRLQRLDLGWIARHRQIAMLLFGLTAGVTAGSVNVMVPLLIIMFLELKAPPTATVQIFNMCFLTGKLMQVAVFTRAGLLTQEMLVATAPLAALAVVTLLAGMALRARITPETYRSWLTRLLWVMAVLLIGQFFSAVTRS
jgi:uncharacterized membrane protein YfcA